MTTIEYLQREIHRTELSIRRAERKPNTPAEELRGLHEKLVHLQEALEAVNEHWQRVHEQRGWTAGEPLTLEQLQVMYGHPVWIFRLEDKKGWWAIVYPGKKVCNTDYGGYFSWESYGKTWLAYTYPPTHIDRETWDPCDLCCTEMICETCDNALSHCNHCVVTSEGKSAWKYNGTLFCRWCGRPLTEEAWAELERWVCGG